MKTAYDIILTPVISEQSMDVAADKKYTFKVATDANKTQVKVAIEEISEQIYGSRILRHVVEHGDDGLLMGTKI